MRAAILLALAAALAGCLSPFGDAAVDATGFQPTDATRAPADALYDRAMGLGRAWRTDAVLLKVDSDRGAARTDAASRSAVDGQAAAWTFLFAAPDGKNVRMISLAANGSQLAFLEAGGAEFGEEPRGVSPTRAALDTRRGAEAIRANGSVPAELLDAAIGVSWSLGPSGPGPAAGWRWHVWVHNGSADAHVEVDAATWRVTSVLLTPEAGEPGRWYPGCPACPGQRPPPPPPAVLYWNGTVSGTLFSQEGGFLDLPMPDAFPPYGVQVTAAATWDGLPVDDLLLTIDGFSQEATARGTGPLEAQATGDSFTTWFVSIAPGGAVQRPVQVALAVTVAFTDSP